MEFGNLTTRVAAQCAHMAAPGAHASSVGERLAGRQIAHNQVWLFSQNSFAPRSNPCTALLRRHHMIKPLRRPLDRL